MTELSAAERLDPIVYVNPEQVDEAAASDIAADVIEKANAGAAMFFALYSLPKECWTGDGPAIQLLRRTGFAKAYSRASRTFIRRDRA